jgi:hypothetical protein
MYISDSEMHHAHVLTHALLFLIFRFPLAEIVAEMTGRRQRLVRVGSGRGGGGRLCVEARGKDEGDREGLNLQEKARFMAGEKLVAVISEAASTGISLHAASTARNQRRRVHITLELPWSADKAIQQLGRTHRSNQASAPVYKLVVAALPGEVHAMMSRGWIPDRNVSIMACTCCIGSTAAVRGSGRVAAAEPRSVDARGPAGGDRV